MQRLVSILPAIAAFAAVMVYARRCLDRRRRDQQLRQDIDSRPCGSPQELYHQHYSELDLNEDRFVAEWVKVCGILGVDPVKARPGDRFDVELEFLKSPLQSSEEIFDLEEYLAETFKRGGKNLDGVNFTSLGEVVVALAQAGS